MKTTFNNSDGTLSVTLTLTAAASARLNLGVTAGVVYNILVQEEGAPPVCLTPSSISGIPVSGASKAARVFLEVKGRCGRAQHEFTGSATAGSINLSIDIDPSTSLPVYSKS